jgi:outer membrane lipoprotein-sorting protein
MARGLPAFVGFVGVSVAMAAPAGAQNVPLPVPAPQPKIVGAPAQVTTMGQDPISKFFAGLGRPNAVSSFDDNQRALADRVSAYLSSIRTLVGDFVQVGADGRRTEGQLYLQKPGRVRFEYDPPNQIELIADGQSVAVRDRKLATQDLYPLSQTPLRFLLADRVDLLRDTHVVGIFADNVFATIVLEEAAIGGKHRLMLMFDAKDLTLKQWTITDPQGFDTTVAVYNLDTTKRPDPNLFKINYERVLQ